MFGDDLFTATARTKGNTDKLLAYSIESVYLLIGYPGPSKSLLYHQQWRGTKWGYTSGLHASQLRDQIQDSLSSDLHRILQSPTLPR